jgi:PAS domain S-box-containing protein
VITRDATYRRIFDAASEALFLHDLGGRILQVNDGMCAMFGYTADEARALSIADLSADESPYTQADAVAHVERAMKDGRAALEWRSRRRSGEVFWSEVVLCRVEIEGSPYVLASVRDIDARKRMEEALRESEERFSRIFNATSTMLAFTEPAGGRIIDVNAAWLAATGMNRADAIGKTGSELRLWERPADRAAILSELATRGRAVDVESVLNMGGRRMPALLSVEYLDMRGERYILWEIRDLTERKRAEEEQELLRAQLLQAQKMESVGQLAGGVAHDFNNILSAILGFTSLALAQVGTQGPVGGYLTEVLRAGERAGDLTRQLLAFSRKQVMQPRVLDPIAVLGAMEPMLRRLIGEDVAFAVILPSTIGRIRADASLLEQAVMNLVVNARDAMPDGGSLTIEASSVDVDERYASHHLELRPGPHVLIAVTDTGVGMSEATQARAFEPFFTTKKPGRGTGLGLSTVYGIVKQTGGAIWLYSEPGRGTTFKLFFPCTGEALPEADERRSPTSRDAAGRTVLVVEDDAQLRTLATTVLRNAGFAVLAAAEPLAALEIARSHPGEIDLLVTDVIMPNMNGKQLAEQLAPLRPKTRVLYMSGYTENTIVHHGVVDEGVRFLPKPITPDRLLATVWRTLTEP